MPELEQEVGRRGTNRVKRLLEHTMRFDLPYDAYQHAERVTLEMLTGKTETYDLTGDHLDEQRNAVTEIYIESKNLAGAGTQGAEFAQFLAQAYSATKSKWERTGHDPKWEFMWATTSPWKGDHFLEVASRASIESAIANHTGSDTNIIPDGHGADSEVVELIEERIWVWVICQRQDDMTPGAAMRGYVLQGLALAGSGGP